MSQRLGILGGTFNPPHLGHLAVARHALARLELREVLLMPSHTPPHKLPQSEPGPARRLRMCELAAEGHKGLRASPLEVERGGPSYTVDTLLTLHARASRPDCTQLTLILGSDMARTLPSWRQVGKLLELADIAVAERPGDGRDEVLGALEPLGARLCFLEMPPIDVSSSMVRERVARGASIAGLVEPAVGAYIAEQMLYRDSGAVTAP